MSVLVSSSLCVTALEYSSGVPPWSCDYVLMCGFLCVWCSWTARRELFGRDVQTGSPVRVPLHWTGLLEGSHHRRGARHHSRLHHDNWNLLQGNTRRAVWQQCRQVLGNRGRTIFHCEDTIHFKYVVAWLKAPFPHVSAGEQLQREATEVGNVRFLAVTRCKQSKH